MFLEHPPKWQAGQENGRQWINWFRQDIQRNFGDFVAQILPEGSDECYMEDIFFWVKLLFRMSWSVILGDHKSDDGVLKLTQWSAEKTQILTFFFLDDYLLPSTLLWKWQTTGCQQDVLNMDKGNSYRT